MSLLIAIVAYCFVASGAPSSQARTATEEFSANFTNISTVGVTGATPITIRVRRWSTDDEHTTLMAILAKDGNDAFTRALQGQKEVGSIGVPTSLAPQ